MKKLRIISIVIFSAWFTSCSDYLDVNRNPSFPQSAPTQVLFPPIFNEIDAGVGLDTRFIGKYVQNFAQFTANDTWDLHGYNAGSDNGGQLWRSHYWAIGLNVDQIIVDAKANQKWWSSGVAKAIRAWSWQTTTDYHGEIILKEAWEPNRYVFDYDEQKDVYAEVIRVAQDALVDLDKDDQTNTLAKGDISSYKGDRDKWKKMVYAVLARNAHHISNKSSYDPAKVIDYVDKAFSSNADNFSITHLGSTTANANPYGPIRLNMGVFKQAAFPISLMNGTVYPGVTDPRMSIMFAPSADNVVRGITPTLSDPNTGTAVIPNLWGTTTFSNASQPAGTIGRYIYKNDSDFPIITYAELQFMKAEAAFKKGDKTTALAAYKNGISAHIDFVASTTTTGIPAAAKTNYLASGAVAQTEAALTISHIMLQKYIALVGHGSIETWVDLRRHHYDPSVYTGFTLPATLFTDNGGKPAYRVRPRYNSEYVWNLASLSKFGGDKPDYHTYEQWFSKPE